MVDLEKWDKKTPLPELLLAVWCLGEVRNLNKIEEQIGGTLLLKIINFFSRDYISLFEADLKIAFQYTAKLLQTANSIGVDWPGKSLFNFDLKYQLNYFIIDLWPPFLAAIFRQRHWIEGLDLETLIEYWPDEETHQFLIQRTIQGENGYIRNTALRLLTEHWPGEGTNQLIKKYFSELGVAASLYGKEHSRFGEVVFWKYAEKSQSLYCDPQQPISPKNIRKAAEEAGIPRNKIYEAVRSLSAHMGWDITKGSLAGKL